LCLAEAVCAMRVAWTIPGKIAGGSVYLTCYTTGASVVGSESALP